MRTAAVVASTIVLALFSACGGSKPTPPAAASPSDVSTDAGAMAAVTSTDPAGPSSNGSGAIVATTAQAPDVVADAGAGAGSGTPDHPFAKDAAQAESMIDDAIDSRHNDMEKCAAEARKRWNEPHMKISLLVGIDQEGSLLGVKRPTKKDKKDDDQLLACVRLALKGAPFPKSHAGVITIKKTYEDTQVGAP